MLDAGYSDGQLDAGEYRARTDAAMTATTLGELDALTADLQIPDHLLETVEPDPVPRRQIPGRLVAVAIAVLAAVATLVALVVTVNHDDDPPTPTETVAAPAPVRAPLPQGEPEPIVIEPIDTTTADGIEKFLRQFRDEFGDLQVDEVTFYPSHVAFTRMFDGQSHRKQGWRFQGGFEPSGAPESRPLDTETIDLADMDVDALGGLIATGADRLAVPNGKVTYIIVEPQLITGEKQIKLYAQNGDKQSGHLTARLDGTVTDVYPPS